MNKNDGSLNAEILQTLREINERDGRAALEFEYLTPEEQRLYMLAAIKNSSLGEILEHPAQKVFEAKQIAEENQRRVDAALKAGVQDGNRLRELAVNVGAKSFAEKRKGLGL